MGKNRLEAFSDGVFAIAITLLIIEIKVPAVESGLAAALLHQWHHWVGYLAGFLVGWLSFFAIYAGTVATLAVGFAMTFISTRTLFGRYVYAIGGNPEAAELAGINTKTMTVKVFALMGLLAAISALVASARLDAATVSLGDWNELYVIAAAVIGGTSLAGGLGTIYGAMLGALLMQSIISGMQLLNLPSAWQNIVVGTFLVVAVYVDQIYRRRVK